jgi:hypothetical protein
MPVGRWRRGAFAVGVAAALVAAGCRQIAGIPDHAPAGYDGSAAPACGIPFVGACGACAQERCCPELAACSRSSACTSMETCVAAAGADPAARGACTRYESAIAGQTALVGAVDACIAAQCSSACDLTCGGLYQVTEPAAAAGCQSCYVDTAACAAAETCAASAGCQAYLHCRQSCVTGDCVAACHFENPDGNDLQQAFIADVTAPCQSACELGSNWSCVGHVIWPSSKEPDKSLTVTLVHLINQSPVPAGVMVAVCNPADFDCATPIGEAQLTASDGTVTVPVRGDTGLNGQDLGLNGYLDISSDQVPPEVVPSLVYWGFPLVDKQAILTAPIVVPSPVDLAAIYAVANVAIDAQRGTLGVVALDCPGIQAIGVTFAATGVDEETQLRYVIDRSTLAPGGPTTSTGSAIFLNVPPGDVTVTATPVSLGRPSSTIKVHVRAGAYTGAAMLPSPSP